jgi:ABC-type Fe3+ transport system permease subunit
MENTIKKLFKSIFKGIGIALLAGIYAVGIGILYLIIRRTENWEFTWILILIAFFSSIYYYNKE